VIIVMAFIAEGIRTRLSLVRLRIYKPMEPQLCLWGVQYEFKQQKTPMNPDCLAILPLIFQSESGPEFRPDVSYCSSLVRSDKGLVQHRIKSWLLTIYPCSLEATPHGRRSLLWPDP